jgi:outer membrane receptor protein involved in Fe transport
MHGLEASAQWQLGSWSFWGAYTWSNSLDIINGQKRARDWDQRNSVSAALSWQSGPWSVAVQSAYRSGRPTTRFVNTALNAPFLGERNAARFAALMTVDARVSRRFAIGSGSLLVFAQVTNLLDRKNLCCTELDLPDEASNPATLEIQSRRSYPLVPALGISYEF